MKPFKQTESGLNSNQGTGLGLAISRKYVQLMGGDIHVSSQLGVGSLFSFEIPTHSLEYYPLSVNTTKAKAIHLAPGQPEYKILVVDDRLDSRLLLNELLLSLGFKIENAENGQEAIDCWKTWQPDLILMDVRMPVMDGLTATKLIKGASLGQKTKIIILTASVFEEDQQKISACGCDDFITKPLEVDNLLEKISHHLGVQYIYQKNETQLEQLSSNSSPNSEENLSSLLTIMSPEWQGELYYAAAQGSDEKIADLIAQIPPENQELMSILNQLNMNFEFQTILEITTNNIGRGQP
ncbi:MAG: response regulator [Planktothrix sp. GU0601_MAG3]|nr:MAG: response regulator [Planktothrix sp. GU0601_MAG3]